MIFDELDIVGFRSIINRTVIKLNSPGVNIITGPNGSGKTQIWNALAWVLYSKPLNEATEVESFKEIRPEKYTGVRVTLKLIKGKEVYHITKTKNFKGLDASQKRHSGISIKLNGEELTGLRDVEDYKKRIVSIIGMSFTLFKNSIMFGQRLRRFIEESGGEQKDIFSEAFEVEFIKLARKKAEDRRTCIYSDLMPLEHKLNIYKAKYDKYKALRKADKEARAQFEKSKLQRKSAVVLTITNKQEDLQNIAKKLKKLPKTQEREIITLKEEVEACQIKFANLKSNQRTIEALNLNLKSQFSYLAELNKELGTLKIQDTCKVCGSKLNGEKLEKAKNHWKKEKKRLLSKIHETTGNIKELEGKLSKLSGKLSSKKELEYKITAIKENIIILEQNWEQRKTLISQASTLNTQIESLEQEHSRIMSETYKGANKHELNNQCNKYRNRIDIYKGKIAPLKKEAAMLEWVISDPLSNTGLKTYIFNSMLKSLNNRLKYYSSILGFNIYFKINLESARKEFYSEVVHRGVLKNYKSLSGGESQLVNIAIAFAIHDIINQSKGINLLVMDEAFEALDEDNIEVVAGLIQLKAENKSLWFITHLKGFEITNAKKYTISLNSKASTTIK